jgi:integrase
MEWVKIARGIEARKHPSRKNGVRFDRYFRGRYTVNNKTRTIAFGWESEKWTENKCIIELASLKEAAIRGEGPVSLREKRDIADKQRETKKAETVTFGQFFEETYWLISKSSKKPGSYNKERQHFRLWISPVIGSLPFQSIKQLQVERIKRNLQKAGRSARTIQYVMATVRQVWNLARGSGFTQEDSPTRKVKIHQPDNRRSRFLTEEESESLLSALRKRSELVYGMALVSLDTGCRFSEVARLRWSDIESKSLRFKDTKKTGGTKSRTVPLTERLIEFFAFMPRTGSLVFPGQGEKVLTEISSMFRDTVKNLGLNDGITDQRDKVVFHTLRHTYASRLVQSGTDLYVVKELLGHSVISMTERYSHLSNDNLVEAVKRMEKTEKEKETKKEKKRDQTKVVELKG